MRTLVIAPHPDDEVLGVGGTLLRRKAEGAELAWLIVTGISTANGWNQEQVERRADEIARVSSFFGFDHVFTLDFPTARLDRIPVRDLVCGISDSFKAFQPEEVFVPNPSDVHTDHRAVFDAAVACTKWFRHPYVRRVLSYEILSETDFGLWPDLGFRPNVFIDITPFLDGKLEAMDIYASEMALFPFPRSRDALRALAKVHGASSGYHAAEAFQLLRERS